jgi:hypothetical protein
MLGAGDSNRPIGARVIFGHILINVDAPICGTHSMDGSQESNESLKAQSLRREVKSWFRKVRVFVFELIHLGRIVF